MKQALLQVVRIKLALFALITMSMAAAGAQQPKPSEQPATPGAAAHYDRMAAAKTVFLKNVGGSDIPFNVISRNFESWGRYILVDSPDNADMAIEIQSPDEGSSNSNKDQKDSGGSKTNVRGGNQQQAEPSTPKPSVDVIILTVYDKNKKPMWIAREEPKFAIRHKAEETHLVEAAQKLFSRFHDRIEPPAKP
ncbi:MAG TPA: hypothetical protein VKY85_13175 [Candidatus Angelobacter sp.]|nr:hypothetical protein [Candidatus Angelobacter sp.]